MNHLGRSEILGSRSGAARVPTTLAEINVTPFVDVMLVLLIVFMISAPLMQQGLDVQLPKASAQALSENSDQVDITIEKNQKILIDGDPVKSGTFQKRLAALVSVKPDIQINLRADAGVDYGFVALVLSEIKRNNIKKVGLVTQPLDRGSNL